MGGTVRRNDRLCLVIGAMAAVLSVAVHGRADDTKLDPAQVEFFENNIRPVLAQHCYECHSQAAHKNGKLKGGLFVDSRDGLLKGGDSGPALVPGNPDESLLIEAVRFESLEMPPSGRLPDRVVKHFEQWVRDGAADPREGRLAARRKIDIDAGRSHWAYRELRVPPQFPTDAAGLSPIDVFLERARPDQLKTTSPADRRTMIRRLYFDLVGLPPDRASVARFVDDDHPLAYERLVDRLLASPHFGERWGRHWLDVVRFAESVTLRGLVQQEAWRYRDFVIASLNDDRPFDQFLLMQVAGDLLTSPELDERRRQLIATTFLTLTNANLEDQDKAKLRMDVVDEQLTVIGKAFLGQTIGCARCHDHKFDPIPTADYYALAGILHSTRTLQHSNVSRWLERPLPVPSDVEEQIVQHEARVKEVQQRVDALKKALKVPAAGALALDRLAGIVLDDEQAELKGEWQRSQHTKPFIARGYQHDKNAGQGQKSATYKLTVPRSGKYEVRIAYTPGSNRSSRVPVAIVDATTTHKRTVNQRQRPPIDNAFVSLGEFSFSTDRPAKVVITNEGTDGHVILDAVQFLEAENGGGASKRPSLLAAPSQKRPDQTGRQKKTLQTAEAELKKLKSAAPKRPLYMAVEEEPEVADLAINIRGNVHNLGAISPRGFLQVATTWTPESIPEGQSGRLQLGRWLAHSRNPLPARVMANRIWHWLFGEGIVRTPDNFGTTGSPPSHPELLDYLAGRLVASRGSVKTVVREVVLSDAYRRSSQSSAAGHAMDPDNVFLWRMNRKRLEAECLLDAILSVSGDLDLAIGGKTIPATLSADYGFRYAGRRRAVYWPFLRNSLPELLQAFDAANPSMVTGRRTVSSVAPQALFLMNNHWVLSQSRIAAERFLDRADISPSDRIPRAFETILGRPPLPAELVAAQEFLQTDDMSTDEQRADRWAMFVQSLIATVDFRYIN